MTLLSSLYTGTSGLAAAAQDLSVISDNIANANTIGFKQSRVDFADALAQNLVGGSGQVGLGASVQAIQQLNTQGALSNTGVSTDLGLQGNGFFQVRGVTADGRNGSFLTRAGQFAFDKDGYLVNMDNLRLQGYQADATGAITSSVGDLLIGSATSPPNQTRTVTVKANLQGDAAAATVAFDPANASATSTFSTSVTLVDALGKTYQVPLYFRKDGTGSWDYHLVTDGANVSGGTAGTPVEIGSGRLTFDASGRMTATNPSPPTFTFRPSGQTADQTIALNLGSTYPAGSGMDGLTQFASPSATTYVGQDGFGAGQVTSVQIDKTGTVSGVFTNGQTRILGQIAIAAVVAPEKLERMGSNLFAATASSGEAVLGAAGSGGRATISAGTLEQSNVDIAEQFVRMISAQRNFEANSKTIQTADSLLQQLIALKR